MRETVLHILIITVVAGTIFFSNLGSARLWDRDEPRNAGCAAEMFARGDLVVPTFNDELRHQKPVLLYWLMMSAYSVFGINEFSARFWSALLGIGTTLATYLIARRLIDAKTALVAGIALASSLMFVVAARAATPDSVLVFCNTMAIMFYVVGVFGRTDELTSRRNGYWFCSELSGSQTKAIFFQTAMFLMMGLGVLAKGPVGFVIPMAVIGMFLLLQRLPESTGQGDTQTKTPNQRSSIWHLFSVGRALHLLKTVMSPFHPRRFWVTLWSMQPLTAAAIILLVAAPWYFMVHWQTEGLFTSKFFVGEHFGRATSSFENHSGGIWFYPLAILVGFFPWSIFWAPVAFDVFKTKKSAISNPTSTGLTLMICWVAVQVSIFTIAQTKLPSYVTPCYPALAILTATFVVRFTEGRSFVSGKFFGLAIAGFLFSGILIVAGAGIATTKFLPSQTWIAGLGLIPVITAGFIFWTMRTKQHRRLPVAFSAGAVLFCLGLFSLGTISIDREQQSHLITDQLRIRPDAQIGTYDCLESSWVYYSGHPIFELTDGNDGSANHQLPRDYWMPKERPNLERFAMQPDAMIITHDRHLEAIKKRLPEDFEVIQTADYFLKNKTLYLLGRPGQNAASRTAKYVEKPIR